jgi:putative sigma-54 modulation protein
MNLQLTGHHVDITPAIRNYVLGKLDRINRHFDHVIDVEVIMTVEKLDQKIEAHVHLSGKDIHVEANHADMYAAIDGLIDKLDRQILKYKERFQVNKHNPGIKRIPQNSDPV